MSQDKKQDHILLIHGTGAGSSFDEGEAWWQRNSNFWRKLSSSFKGFAEVQPHNEVFHWSGENSETARREAGADLLERLQQLENDGRSYHLIGHSHGGSVIWHSLKYSAASGRKLAGLRSWSTVATPFIHIKPKFFDYWSIVPLIMTIVSGYFCFNWIGPYVRHVGEMWDLGDKFVSILLPLFWFILVTIGIGLLVKLTRVYWSIKNIVSDNIASNSAFSLYGDRWLALWSSEDEAINGLVTSLDANGEIIPRSTYDTSKFSKAVLVTVMSPISFFYDKVFAAAGDAFIWDRLKERAQGNDLFGARVASVSPSIMLEGVGWPELPAEIHGQLKELADKNAARFLGDFRTSLGLVAEERQGTSGLLNHMKSGFTFTELIHTSYFDLDVIEQVLSLHISRHMPSKLRVPDSLISADIRDWIYAGAEMPRVEIYKDKMVKSHGQRSLGFLSNCSIAVVTGIVGVSAFTVSESLVKTYTENYQVEILLRTTPVRRISAMENAEYYTDPNVSAWLAALVRNGHLSTAKEQANWFQGGNAELTYSVILSSLLRIGQASEAAELIFQQPWLLRQDDDIARTLKRDGALDAMKLLVKVLPSPDNVDFNYNPGPVVEETVVAFSDAGRIDEAIGIVEAADDELDKDDMWAAVAVRLAQSGQISDAFELSRRVKDKTRKLIVFEAMLDVGEVENEVLTEIASDVISVFKVAQNCGNDRIPGFSHDYFEKWIVRLMKSGLADEAAHLGKLCHDRDGFGILASYFANKGVLPSPDAIKKITDGMGITNSVSEALAQAGFIDDALTLYPQFKDNLFDKTKEALVVPLINAGRLEDLRLVISEETETSEIARLSTAAFKGTLAKGEIDSAREFVAQVDWSEFSPKEFVELSDQVKTIRGESGMKDLLAILEEQLQASESELNRLYIAIWQLVAVDVLEPEKQDGVREVIFNALSDLDWKVLDDQVNARLSGVVAGLAQVGFVVEAERIADFNQAWWNYDPYREIAREYLKILDVDSMARALEKNRPGVGWYEMSFSTAVEHFREEKVLAQVESEVQKLIAADHYTFGESFISDFAQTLMTSGHYDRAVQFVDMIEEKEDQDNLLLFGVSKMLVSQQYSSVANYLERIETYSARQVTYHFLAMIADGGRGLSNWENVVHEIQPNLQQAKEFAALMPEEGFRAHAYTYLAGAVQRSGGSDFEILKLLDQATSYASQVTNPDEIMPQIAAQYAEIGRIKTAATMCQECSPSVIAKANAKILNAIWYSNNGIERDDKVFGTYDGENFSY